ncbi:hypothetical protein GCM10009827_118320 [Dactylosporangium maewongense]|uniref:Uncharacterized protein n=1 Tax=Dactylosporangium maewongense TaxID=634393 RepID=A0ABP4PCY8_9ACTN
MAGLGVQGVGDEYDPGQVAVHGFDGVEQWCGRRDFVRLRLDGHLGQDDAGAGVQGGEEMDVAAVGAAGAAQGLAVHGDDGAVAAGPGQRGPGAGAQPAGEDLGEQAGVEAGQQPPHRRARRYPAAEPEPGLGLLVEVVQPVADRGE